MIKRYYRLIYRIFVKSPKSREIKRLRKQLERLLKGNENNG